MVDGYVCGEPGNVCLLDLRIIKIVEVIEDDDLVSALQQLLDEMRSNETRATCHQNSHGAKLATDDHRWTQISRLRPCCKAIDLLAPRDCTLGPPGLVPRPAPAPLCESRMLSGLTQTPHNLEIAPVQ